MFEQALGDPGRVAVAIWFIRHYFSGFERKALFCFQ
jgi:hypothetical protein